MSPARRIPIRPILGLALALALGRSPVRGGERRAPEERSVQAGDGAALSVTVLPAERHPEVLPSRRGGGAKVLLLPGAGLGGGAFFPPGGPSLARFLAYRGFEAWVAPLRGQGGGMKPGTGDEADRWTLDDEARLDLPALVGAAAQGGAPPAVVAFGPAAASVLLYLADRPATLPAAVAFLAPWASSQMPNKTFLKLESSAGGGWACPDGGEGRSLLWFGTSGVPPARRTALLRSACVALPLGVLGHLRRSLDRRTLVHAGGEPLSSEGLAAVALPVWFGVGIRDNLAQPEDAEPFYELLSGARRTWHVFSLSGGEEADYDHASLLWGSRAPREVYPALADWLAEARKKAPR